MASCTINGSWDACSGVASLQSAARPGRERQPHAFSPCKQLLCLAAVVVFQSHVAHLSGSVIAHLVGHGPLQDTTTAWVSKWDGWVSTRGRRARGFAAKALLLQVQQYSAAPSCCGVFAPPTGPFPLPKQAEINTGQREVALTSFFSSSTTYCW